MAAYQKVLEHPLLILTSPSKVDPKKQNPSIHYLPAMMFVEKTPLARSLPSCHLPSCDQPLTAGEYRIASFPARKKHDLDRKPFFYHVQCIERIADFTKPDVLHRVFPMSPDYWPFRGVPVHAIAHPECYLLDSGSIQIVQRWKLNRARLIDKRDGKLENNEAAIKKNINRVIAKCRPFNGDLLNECAASLSYAEKAINMSSPITRYKRCSSEEANLEEEVVIDKYLKPYRKKLSLDNRYTLSKALTQYAGDCLIFSPIKVDECLCECHRQEEKVERKRLRGVFSRLAAIDTYILRAEQVLLNAQCCSAESGIKVWKFPDADVSFTGVG